jgi:hypothetical protein
MEENTVDGSLSLLSTKDMDTESNLFGNKGK